MVNVAILCEGRNDKKFFESLINHLDVGKNQTNFYVLGGKSKFFDINNSQYKDLKLEIDSGQIDKVLFVIDADNITNDAIYGGYEKTEIALNKIIEQLDIKKVSLSYIMCDPATKIGYLESFILSTIPNTQRNCIECFLECSQFPSKENHKAILNQIYNIAYPHSPYDFKHTHFDLLKTALANLYTI